MVGEKEGETYQHAPGTSMGMARRTRRDGVITEGYFGPGPCTFIIAFIA